MICPKCGGDWQLAIIYNRRMQICSRCNFIDGRSGSCDGIEHGPKSPLLTDGNCEPASLKEHLSAWWGTRRSIGPIKIVSFVKWCWSNWSKNWDNYHREQKELIDLLKKG